MINQDLLQRSAAALGVPLTTDQARQLAWLGDELIRWNTRINLTAITAADEVLEKHLLDALAIAPWIEGPVIDLGSGAGFPGLPLKIVRPELKVVSLDSVDKKLGFQRHVARQLDLHDFRTLHARIEQAAQRADQRQAYRTVVARALAGLAELVPLMAPFCAPDGQLLAMKGPEAEVEIADAMPALQKLGFLVAAQHRWQLPRSGAERTLVVLRRIATN